MDLHVTQEAIPEGTRRTLCLTNIRGITGHHHVDIFFDLIGTTAPKPTILDGFIFGVIFYAMRIGQDVQVHGAVSRDGLFNLHEFQEAWTSWKPHAYKKIKILPETITDYVPPEGRKRAIAAFSGGVDSTFTILRHGTKQLGDASYPLHEAVLMVDGFDVPLDAPEQLEALKRRTKPLLDELGLKLLTIRTNLKEVDLQDWEDSFMSQLACCLHNYSHDFYYGLAGSAEPYSALVIPWGSNPATDHLLSGDAMRLVVDGYAYSRTAKVAYIATHATAMRVLKVCWEGNDASKNCGTCEKCIRTQMNFLAVGLSQAPCFEKPFDFQLIATMALRNDAQCNQLASIYGYAEKAGIADEWMKILKARIDRYQTGPDKLPQKFVVTRKSVLTREKFHRLFLLIKSGEFAKIIRKLSEFWVGLRLGRR